MQMEYAKIIARTAAGDSQLEFTQSNTKYLNLAARSCPYRRYTMPFKIFYQALLQSQLAYSLLRKDLLPHFSIEQLSAIIELCLRIIKK